MKDYNMKPTYEQVHSSQIRTDIYQREVKMAWVRKIIAEFDPALCNPIKVSLRDGQYYAFDGHHTLTVLRIMNGGRDLPVPCLVYEGLTFEDEAFLFSRQTGASHNVAMDSRLQALYLAKDVRVTDMYDVVNSLGFIFDFGGTQAAKKIIAGATLWRIYQNSTRNEFIDVLEIVRDSWNFNPDSLKKEILGGVHYFYTFPPYKGRIDKKTLISKLSPAEPRVIIREGKARERGGDKRYANVIYDIYNKGLKSNRLPRNIYTYED